LELLKENDDIKIINEQIIPALNEIGNDFENKKLFLPQLLVSSETAKVSFDIIKNNSKSNKNSGTKIVLATVKGDIHDIGKNIVKMLLENYGYTVIDLGKDVEPKSILDAVIKNGVNICGLSALMTTTVQNMKETIELLKDKAPNCKTIVGGAVLTKEYANSIGADFYAKDAMETVKIVQTIEKEI
ncbi:MAG: cobalamin-dependent protein, partial [Firmicutes bacterium]|nr:cobalamin-dependent protein [Candidatus Caballimonas caccae]